MHTLRADLILVVALAITAPAAAEVTRKGEGCLCPGTSRLVKVPVGTDCSVFCGTRAKSPSTESTGGSGRPGSSNRCANLAYQAGQAFAQRSGGSYSEAGVEAAHRQFLREHPECAGLATPSLSPLADSSDAALVGAATDLVISIFDAIGQHQANKRQRKQQEAVEAQERSERMREVQEQARENFDQSKEETLAMMKGSSSPLSLKPMSDPELSRLQEVSSGVRSELVSLMTSLGMEKKEPEPESGGCDDLGCLEGCPTIEGVMESREVDAACVRRCASSSCADDRGTSAVAAGGGEGDYFYDLQMRRTMPSLTPPLGEMTRLDGRYVESWRLANPEISVDRSVIERLEDIRNESADRTIEWAKEQVLDNVLEGIPGASTLKSTYQAMMPIADSVITNAFDRLNEAPGVLAFGEARDIDATIARGESSLDAVYESVEAAAHGQLLDSVSSKVWKDKLTEGIEETISERWGFAPGESDGDPEQTFLNQSVWSIPEHPDAFRWRNPWGGSGGGRE